MFKGKVNLDKVSIAAKCPVAFEGMQGDEKVRACSMCNMNVYNISNMKRKEAEKFLEESIGKSICLQLYRRQDGTLITKDCPVGRRLADSVKRRMRSAAAFFVALLSCEATFAQQSQQPQSGQAGTAVQNAAKQSDVIFQVEGQPIDIRHFTYTPQVKTVLKKAESAGQLNVSPDYYQPDLSNTMFDTTATDALHKAAWLEVQKKYSEASGCYERALNFVRSTQGHDPMFVREVAKSYARCLRKLKEKSKAAAIEKEFRIVK